ncbi:cartenoid oxygenase, putative, partial [Perkinsus marinus ATCC 50983]
IAMSDAPPPALAKSEIEKDAPRYCKGWYNARGTKMDMWLEDFRGKIPLDIRGTFIRNGPGVLEVYGEELRHPIDGDGLVVALAFRDGKAHLRSRFVSTFSHVEEEAAGRMLYPGQMGSEPRLPAAATLRRCWVDDSS